MSLLLSLRSERLKSRRTIAGYLTLAAAFTPVIGMLDLFLDGVEPKHRATIFNEMFTSRYGMTGALSFPIFIILVCTLLPQIEHKNNTWKQLLSSPQGKWNIYLAKFINVQFFALFFLLIDQVLVLASAVILHFNEPRLNVLGQPLDGRQVAITLANSYISLLAITAVQFWMGIRFRNFVVSTGIGIGLWLAGSILVIQTKPGQIQYFPYSFHMYASFPEFGPKDMSSVLWSSLGLTAVFLWLGFLSFRTRRMIG